MGDNVRFLSKNYITSITDLTSTTGTDNLVYLIDRNENTQWIGTGVTGTGTEVITWFLGTTTINRLYIKNHNLDTYSFYYNENPANTFTPDISVTGNTGDNSYHEVGTQTINSITLYMGTLVGGTTIAGAKKVGELYYGTQQFEAESNPVAESFDQYKSKKGFDLEMADGGVKSIWLADKYKANVTFDFVSTSALTDFKDLYNGHSEFVFLTKPVSTGTGWNGDAWHVNWVGDFHGMNLTGGLTETVGYTINLDLWEVHR